MKNEEYHIVDEGDRGCISLGRRGQQQRRLFLNPQQGRSTSQGRRTEPEGSMKTDHTLLRAIATFILALLMLGGVMKAKGETFTQQEIVAITILAEARGEGKRGMYAVACVISKRMKERKKTGAQVCLQPWQFSCWNKNDPQRPHLRKLLRHELAPYAMKLAKNIDNLQLKFVEFANHYHTKRVSPYWSKGKRPVATIGNHVFFKL